jgi:energy-coupling factor transporter ATP-binding protein EcfA2
MPALPFSHITVDNFRGLHALEVGDLRTINLLVGGNNSGKTSVLEAIALLANPVSGDEWLQVVRRRDFGRLDESFVMSLRWCFTQGLGLSGAEPEENEFQCQFSVKGAHPLRAMKSVYREFFAEVEQKELGFSKARYNALMNDATVELNAKTCTIDSLLEWSGEVPNQLDSPSQASTLRVSELMSPLMASLLGRGGVRPSKNGLNYAALLPYSYQLNTLQVSTRSKQLFFDDNSLLLDLLRQFDKDVINVEVASFAGLRPAIYIKHAKLGVAPLSVFGDAMRRCLLLATTMTSLGRGGVLLLDEVEVGVHTDALPRVFKWLADAAKQLEIQVIATTHSLEVLDALLASDLGEDDLAAYQLKQTEERTECKRFAGSALKRLRYERGLDIR